LALLTLFLSVSILLSACGMTANGTASENISSGEGSSTVVSYESSRIGGYPPEYMNAPAKEVEASIKKHMDVGSDYYDCNYSFDDRIQYRTMTWSALYSAFSGISSGVERA
ncbi:MAG: hypothetical protein ACERKO_13535, partial [Acetanaerobacterium sp.]